MCESFLLKSKQNDVVVGRLMEFVPYMLLPELKVVWHLVKVPTGTDFCSYMPVVQVSPKKEQQVGWTWQTKYRFIGISGFGKEVASLYSKLLGIGATHKTNVYCCEGINEEGLSVGCLTYDNNMQWANGLGGGYDIYYAQFADYLLGLFANIGEIRNALTADKVSLFCPGEKFFQPAHFIAHDAAGESLIIEVDKQKITAYDATYLTNNGLEFYAKALDGPLFGYMTNAPKLDWQYTHLRQYLHLSPYDPARDAKDTAKQLSHGEGMVGLPGDYSSPSRFLKLSTLLRFAERPDNLQEAKLLANHMLNAATIVKGVVFENQQATPKTPAIDHTSWVTVKELKDPKLYVRTYQSSPFEKAPYQKYDFSDFPNQITYDLLP
jgi:choloylglycine hydrolase